jgi:hypothetical protein
MTSPAKLLDRLWQDYANLNPQAKAIHKLLEARGESVTNDHIAFRTFRDPIVGVDVVASHFEKLGYAPKGEYVFPDKKLFARHYEHADPAQPKVFISELKVEEFSPRLRQTVRRLIDQVPPDAPRKADFPASGRPWKVSHAEYELLRSESEYAAWMSAFGFRANHFTVLVNALKTFKSLQELNEFLKTSGFKLNSAGGEIKGSPQVLLEQSSTLADQVNVDFSDGARTIPCCYYEFAKRYPQEDGKLFQGFVERSADKIFESTNKR